MFDKFWGTISPIAEGSIAAAFALLSGVSLLVTEGATLPLRDLPPSRLVLAGAGYGAGVIATGLTAAIVVGVIIIVIIWIIVLVIIGYVLRGFVSRK